MAFRIVSERLVFVGLAEDYDVAILLFCQWLGDATFRPSGAVRNKARYALEWTLSDHPDLWRLVEDVNAQDIALYEKVRTDLFSTQRSTYKGDMDTDLAQLRSLPRQDDKESLWPKIKRTYLYKPMLHIPI